MNDETQQISKPTKEDSKLFGISLRGLIALIVVLTICAMSFCVVEVKEPLYTLGGLIVGFYFGQNQRKP